MKCNWQTESGTVNSPQVCGKKAAKGYTWCKEHIAHAKSNYPGLEIPATTLVIFRKWPKSEGGGILALFPYDPGTNDPYTCSCYEHIGQHGSANPGMCIAATKPAKPEEYANLKAELESEPYNYVLVVRRRLPSDAVDVRRKQLASYK
jgi:hypothetical protein